VMWPGQDRPMDAPQDEIDVDMEAALKD
jgi:hypothetical protein